MNKWNPLRFLTPAEWVVIAAFAMLAAFMTPTLAADPAPAAATTLTADPIARREVIAKAIAAVKAAAPENAELIIEDLGNDDEESTMIGLHAPSQNVTCLARIYPVQGIVGIIRCERGSRVDKL